MRRKGMQAGMNQWFRNGKRRYALFTAAAVFLCAGIIYIGAGGITDQWKYRLQQTLFHCSGEMYMPGILYAGSPEKQGASGWLREKALAWMPLIGYVEDHIPYEETMEDEETIAKILESQANDENMVDESGNLIGDPDESETEVQTTVPTADLSIEKLRDFDYLLSHFYIVDSSTMIGPEQLNVDDLLGRSMKIDTGTDGPKVLIYHTHSQETFADSVPGDVNTSIVGIGAYLAELLNNTYQIETLHHQGVYDLIDGKLDRSMAYQLAEPEITKILQENPSIQVVIDLHRDGVAEGTHLVTDIGGKATAQIMFFNGLSRSRANGEISYLPNPYIEENLAFSLQMQIAAAEKYPGFTRHIYLRAYRYNMHLAPRTLLVEAGAQTNTVEEMRNAMEILADTLDCVLTE